MRRFGAVEFDRGSSRIFSETKGAMALRAAGGDALDLLQVIDIVAGHRLDDGPESHGSTFWMSRRTMTLWLSDCGQ